MSLGGRPKEEGGHEAINITVDAEIYRGLEKIRDKGGNRSKFIEHAVRPHIRQLDPGESCKVLVLVDRTLYCGIASAISNQDFEKAATLATIGNSLAPFRSLCKISARNGATESMDYTLELCKPFEDMLCDTIRSFPDQSRKAQLCDC